MAKRTAEIYRDRDGEIVWRPEGGYVDADGIIHEGGRVFPAVVTVVDPTMPPDELHFRDSRGRTVGKIVNLAK